MFYEDALKKTQRVKSDNDCYTPTIDRRSNDSRQIEEKLEMMQRTIRDLSLRNKDIWCTLCMVEGHTKDNCRNREDRIQDVLVI